MIAKSEGIRNTGWETSLQSVWTVYHEEEKNTEKEDSRQIKYIAFKAS